MLSVVRKLKEFKADGHKDGEWVNKRYEPLKEPQYIGSGGHYTTDLQKAQVFGFSKSARNRVDRYRNHPDDAYEVIDVEIVPQSRSNDQWIKIENITDLPIGEVLVKVEDDRRKYEIARTHLTSAGHKIITIGNVFDFDYPSKVIAYKTLSG